MVYTEKFKVKGRVYYKLVHTVREGSRITHRTKYLGKSLPPKERLRQLEKEFLQRIKGQRYNYISADEFRRIEEKRSNYIKETKKLSPLELKNRLEEFIIRFTYESSKLSGVDVTLRQTYLILREGVMPDNIKSLKNVKEIENHQ